MTRIAEGEGRRWGSFNTVPMNVYSLKLIVVFTVLFRGLTLSQLWFEPIFLPSLINIHHFHRLVLSSPMVNSAEFSRTTSGHSFLSLRSYDSSLTPISQALNHNQTVFGPNGSNYPNYATTNNNQQQYHYHRNRMLPSYNGNPMPAWEIQQQPITDLPPLRASPPMQKRQMKGFIKYPDSNQLSKWYE